MRRSPAPVRHAEASARLKMRKSTLLTPGSMVAKGTTTRCFRTPPSKQRLGLGKGRLEIERDHDVRFRVLRLMGQLRNRVERIEIHDRAAGLQDRVVIDDEGWAIRQEQPNARSLPDAKRLQAFCRAVHLMRQLRIGHGLAEKAGRGPRAEFGPLSWRAGTARAPA